MSSSRSFLAKIVSLLFLANVINVSSASLIDHIAVKVATKPKTRNVAHQNIAANPPLPILEIGLEHMLAQIAANESQAEYKTVTPRHPRDLISRLVPLNKRTTAASCSATSPCIDGSCCNSAGVCGFTSSTCLATSTTTCISNCDAYAMCGVNSLDGNVKCPYNLCCSNSGYCGSSDLYCTSGSTCQEGFGNCAVIAAPTCQPAAKSATNGRNVAYWQSTNLIYRACNRIDPAHINTAGLTHLLFAFASFDPNTFQITPAVASDIPFYSQFTALKTTIMQTWIAVGGGDFTDSTSSTFHAWSAMTANAANRATFIASLIAFMVKYGFQGVDLDWEYPTVSGRGGNAADLANFVSLIKEMKASFGTTYGISLAIPLDYANLIGIDSIDIQDSVSFFNVMAYDLHGPWEASYNGAIVRSQTSILDIEEDLKPLWFAGINPAKLNLGLAAYGRGYKLSTALCDDVECPYSGASDPGTCTNSAGILSLQEIKTMIAQQGLVPTLLADEMIKQIVWNGNWMGYDDVDTFALKRAWADARCFGGSMTWSIDFNSGVGADPVPANGCGLTAASPPSLCPNGQCCSSHGYCGTSSDYCAIESGCQSEFGSCTPSTLTISVDATCGGGTGSTCQGSMFGNCCSAYGYCGGTASYCGAGCQSGFGSCS